MNPRMNEPSHLLAASTTRDQHHSEPFTPLQLASAAALIRELRHMIPFALSEPEFLPEDQDPDTGETAPVVNQRPALHIDQLISAIENMPAALHLLKQSGFCERTLRSEWKLLLDELPSLSREAPYLQATAVFQS